MKKRKITIAVSGGILLLAAVFFLANKQGNVWEVLNHTRKGSKATIVIDAGHGGFDPGKVGVSNTLEKDINLAIAKKLETLLEENGYTVVMTRSDDRALCAGTERSKKMADMTNRVALIEETKPALAVSIHQNSFSAGTKGAQVFYYTESGASKMLAEKIQADIKEAVGDDNHRKAKGNRDYYMLRKTTCPFVIVECGFLSNPEEEQLLCDEKYQGKMAKGIAEGVENFLYK